MVGAALVLSVSAFYVLKNRHVESSKAAFKAALPIFVVFSIVQLFLFGAESAVNVTENQPVKLAAMEGLWEDTACAPMVLVGWVDVANQRTVGIKIPCVLSILAGGSPDAVIQGLNSFPPDTWPPVNLVFQSYHLMLALGASFVGLGLLGALMAFWKQRIWQTRWLLWLFVASIFLTEVSTMTGWWTAEFGRQPWIVWNLLRTVDAVSPNITGGQVFAAVLMFVLLYALLLALFIFLLNEKIQHGPDKSDEEMPVKSLPDTFKDLFGRARA
jgi:cytochrome d ubiquinol oxidase subunit I